VLSALLGGAFVALSLMQAVHYRGLERNIFFLAEQFEAERLRNVIKSLPENDRVFLVVENRLTQCDWTYADGRFFKVYFPAPKAVVHCLVGLPNLPSSVATSDALVITSRTSTATTANITDAAKSWVDENRPYGRNTDLLLPQFSLESVTPQGEAATPSGRGAFTADAWPTSTFAVPALIVVSGFNATVPLPKIEPGMDLRFAAAMPYKATGRARFKVALQDAQGRSTEIWAEEFLPPEDGVTRLRSFKIPLPAGRSMFRTVTFGIETLTPDSSAHWAVFAHPRVTRPAPIADRGSGAATVLPAEKCELVGFPPGKMRSLTWCEPPEDP
jgi:hypothetical protein